MLGLLLLCQRRAMCVWDSVRGACVILSACEEAAVGWSVL